MEGFANKNYVLDKILGKGPEGQVYRAQRVSDGVVCAIKELDVRHMTEEEKEDATEEIRVLATVHNENVIKYYDAFVDENKLYVVMEYCDQADLGRHIKTHAEQQKFFSEAQLWSFVIQMLRGLVALHAKGLIHRNVRSGNVIHLDSNALKLGDVGVGKLTNEDLAANQIGNPHYVPPEVWKNKAYTFKSDVWAVGCVLYELITLAVPFGGCSLPDLRLKVIQGRYQPIPSSFSSGLSKVLKLLLNPDQASRVSASVMLSHPIIQAHFQCAPAPAPLLRLRASDENVKLGPISVHLPIQPKSSTPTLAVPPDKQVLQMEALPSKQTATTPPPNRHQQDEKPPTTLIRSKVVPILAPRAILSSPDNDEMVSELNSSSNQMSKVKVPRVATLGKVIPNSPSEASVAPQTQGVPSTPSLRVNLKHFKTAYIQSPKVDSDEFPATESPIDHVRSDISGKEKLENPVNTQGMPKIKSVSTPGKAATPRREKSIDSIRSVASSLSEDSLVRARPSTDGLDSSHSKAATPRREKSAESIRSVGSSLSEDSLVRARPSIDGLDSSHSKAATPRREKSAESVRSVASSRSEELLVRARPSTDGLDSSHSKAATPRREKSAESVRSVADSRSEELLVRARPSTDGLDSSYSKAATPRRENSAESVRSVANSRSEELLVRARPSIDSLDSSHSKAATPRREMSTESASSGASSQSEDLLFRVRAPMDISDMPQPSLAANNGHSLVSVRSGASSGSDGSGVSARVTTSELDSAQQMKGDYLPPVNPPVFPSTFNALGIGKEESEDHSFPLRMSNTSPVASSLEGPTSGRDSSAGSLQSMACNGVVTHLSEDSATHIQAVGPEQAQRLNESTGNGPLSSNGLKVGKSESSAHTSRVSVTKPVSSHTKVATSRINNSLKPVPGDCMARKPLATSVTGERGPVDVTDKFERLPNSTRNRRLSFDGVKREKLETDVDVSGLSKASPRGSHTKVATPRREKSGVSLKPVAGDVLAKDQSNGHVFKVGTAGDATLQRLQKPTGNRRLSLDGTKKEKLDTPAVRNGVQITRPPIDHTTNAVPRREKSIESRKLAAGNGAAIKDSGHAVTSLRTPVGVTGSGQIIPESTGLQKRSSDGLRKEKSRNPGDPAGVGKAKPSTPHTKLAMSRNNSSESLKTMPAAATPTRKNSSCLEMVKPSFEVSKQQADGSPFGMRAHGADPAQSPQKPIRSRRLSLDFPIEGKEIQSRITGNGYTAGAINGRAN